MVEGTQTLSVVAGTIVRFSTDEEPFTDLITGAPADPTIVVFAYRVGRTSVQFVYGALHSPVVRDGVGVYHCDVDTTGMAVADSSGLPQMVTLIGEFAGQGVAQTTGWAAVEVTSPPVTPTF